MQFDGPAEHLDVYKHFRHAPDHKNVRYRVCYGGSGSGKSVAVAQDHIDRAGQDGARVLTLRKVGKTCRNSTFQLYKDLLRASDSTGAVSIRDQEMVIDFPGDGKIIHSGLDDTEKLKSITGITHIWIEEATELAFPNSSSMQEPDLAQIDLRLRGVSPDMHPCITLTFNPIKRAAKIFDYLQVPESKLPSHGFRVFEDVFVQHNTYQDNPHVGEDYVSVFRRLGGAMQAAYERGELVRIDQPDQVIPYEMIRHAQDIEPEDGRQYLGIDVARFGADRTTLALISGNALRSLRVFKPDNQDDRRSTSTAHAVMTLAREKSIPAPHVGVDAIGLGAGVIDTMYEDGFRAVDIISGGKPVKRREPRKGRKDTMRYKNLRSQMWWTLREALEEGRLSLKECAPQSLIEDLCAPRYRLASERTIQVEPKHGNSASWGITQRLGHSPDEGDAIVYANAIRELHIQSRQASGGGFSSSRSTSLTSESSSLDKYL